MRKGISGFTIVELLFVIVVIAILSTLLVIAYNGMQNRANDAAVQSDLKSLASKLSIYRVDNPTYPVALVPNSTALDSLGFKVTKSAYQTTNTSHNLSYCYPWDDSSYVVVARSKSGTVFAISSARTTPRILASSWDANDALPVCAAAEPDITTENYLRGFAASDTTTGPWRDWAGGN